MVIWGTIPQNEEAFRVTQRMIEIVSPVFVPEDRLASGESLADIFDNNGNPMALEVGCGTGHFVVELARRNPHVNYVAIDIYNKGCYKTCRKIEEEGLSNVRVLRMEARYLLSRYVPEESLAAVYVNCPDPWPKKRHRRRRLVDSQFLEMLLCYLRPGGDFCFSSDFRDYAEDVAQALSSLSGYENRLEEPVVHHLPGYPLSKYMRRFLDKGQNINFLHWRKGENVTLADIPHPEINPGFRVAWQRVENE